MIQSIKNSFIYNKQTVENDFPNSRTLFQAFETFYLAKCWLKWPKHTHIDTFHLFPFFFTKKRKIELHFKLILQTIEKHPPTNLMRVSATTERRWVRFADRAPPFNRARSESLNSATTSFNICSAALLTHFHSAVTSEQLFSLNWSI